MPRARFAPAPVPRASKSAAVPLDETEGSGSFCLPRRRPGNCVPAGYGERGYRTGLLGRRTKAGSRPNPAAAAARRARRGERTPRIAGLALTMRRPSAALYRGILPVVRDGRVKAQPQPVKKAHAWPSSGVAIPGNRHVRGLTRALGALPTPWRSAPGRGALVRQYLPVGLRAVRCAAYCGVARLSRATLEADGTFVHLIYYRAMRISVGLRVPCSAGRACFPTR